MNGQREALIAGYLELNTVDPEGDRRREPAAVYLHFPFCRSLCTYCDFDTFAGQDALIDSYVEAALRQIRCSPEVAAGSLYLGGGTPSMMLPGQTAALVAACRERFGLPVEAETTLEANPSGVEAARLEGFREAGFNRLSLGVQSCDDRLLRVLGRRHRAAEARATVEAARAAGFTNLSLDLIFGVPHQSLAAWRETLDTVAGWGVQHLSCYMLTVEPGTPLERGVSRGTLRVPEDEEVVAMYRIAGETLLEAGFSRYEISNWSRPGFQSLHNLVYWRNQPYLGIGAGAAGCWGGRRYKILPDLLAYARGTREGRIPLAEDEEIDPHHAMSDTLILGLRLSEGVSRAAFLERHGVEPEGVFGEALDWAMGLGLLESSEDHLKLTEQGILLSNELFQRLL